MTFTLTKKHLFSALLLSLFLAFSLAWWLTDTLSWLYAVAALLVLLSIIVLWSINRAEPAVKRQKFLEKQDQQLVKKLFQSFMQELKDRGQNKYKYRMPWYLFISHDITSDQRLLAQMGFRNSSANTIGQQLPTQLWLKNNAVIIVIEMSNQDYRALNCLKLLIKQVKKFRARQSLNGILCSQSVAYLLQNDKSHSQQMASDNRLVINEVQNLAGQQLPIYVIFNQMAGLADFCQFFASLDENKLEGAFGVLNNDKAQAGVYQSRWFNKVYDNLCRRMGNAVLSALDSQLSESFRRSAVAAPIQFKQVKSEVGFFLEQLFLAKNSEFEYLFRGFFFSNAEQQFTATDPLTEQVAYQLGFNEMLQADDVKLSHSLFVNQFFDDFIRPEASMAGINNKVKRLFWGFQISYSVVMLALISSVLLLLKANYDYYQPLNAKTVLALNSYKMAVKKQPYDLAELANNVTNLAKIRKIYLDYNQRTPFYISRFIPNPAITEAVQQAYHQELSSVLLPAMVLYLADELFVYETLGDTLKVAKLLQLNDELVLHDQSSWQHLQDFYRHSFIKEDQINRITVEAFIALMDDLYRLGVPKVMLNTALLTQAKVSLAKSNSTEVLFDYIKNLPQFASNIDISADLGNNFEQLYQFEQATSGKLVPYLFTPKGFASIDLSESSALFKQVINNNKALLGHRLNLFEKSNLSKNLQRYYQRSYINFWLGFINNISIKSVNAESLSHNIAMLTSLRDAPLSQLHHTIAHYTHPNVLTDNSEKNVKDKVLAKTASLIAQYNDKNIMAKAIQAEFSLYHSFIKQDEKGVSELTQLQKNIAAVHQWLQQANRSNSAGAFYFQQLSANQRNLSLYQLNHSQISIESIRMQVQSLSRLVNESVMAAMSAYINQAWQQQISTPFIESFAGKFPFDMTSDANVNFKHFNRFFRKTGDFSKFNQQFLAKFSQGEQQLTLKGFTANTPLVINGANYRQLINIASLQQALYQQDPSQLAINFKIKAHSMSANLLAFELFSDGLLFDYQHGPKLWTSFSWPMFTSQTELLAVFTNIKNQKNTNIFDGQWAWLRLIYQSYLHNATKPQIKIINEQTEITLLISVEGDFNPLQPRFFSRIKLSDRLL
ncbi:MAG: type VI secretion protein IcmF/TssM N-terminal domain-containing protein [Colwellia sp.]